MKKLGIRFDPPSLILLYHTSTGKLHQRVMPIRNFSSGSNITFIASQMKSRHRGFLDSVPLITIEKMLHILQEHLKGISMESILQSIDTKYKINPEEDLNKLSEEQLQRKKLIMEASFVANQLEPTDPNFEYDRQENFEEHKIESGWDSDIALRDNENGDDFWD